MFFKHTLWKEKYFSEFWIGCELFMKILKILEHVELFEKLICETLYKKRIIFTGFYINRVWTIDESVNDRRTSWKVECVLFQETTSRLVMCVVFYKM